MSQAAVIAAMLLCVLTQRASSQIVENDQMRLELIGLKRWTVSMIDDSLRRYSPQDSLLSHACAAVLREKLKFADASVVYYTTVIDGKPTKPYLAVTVVEPQDSALIRYRGPFKDSLPSRRAWTALRTVFERHNDAFQQAVQRPDFLWSQGPLRAVDSALSPALPLRQFLRTHRGATDRQLSLRTLATDGNWQNRVAAIVILANFADNDSVWWALTDALRDPVGVVSATSGGRYFLH